ncbi:MAG: prepilin-type N-terminal cleavage/methylation domain-containing protein [Mycobacteriales bacterium]
MLSRRDGRGRRDAGFSLVELLVALLLVSVVGTIVLVTLNSGFRSTTLIQRETDISAEFQRTVERISRELRVADPLEAAVPSENRIQVRVLREGGCYRYFYLQESTELVQYIQTPLLPTPPPPGSPTVDGVCTTAAPASLSALPRKVLLRGLTPGTTVFRYYAKNGAQLTFPGAQTRDVAQVEITLRRAGGSGAPVTVATRVDLRNKQEAPK